MEGLRRFVSHGQDADVRSSTAISPADIMPLFTTGRRICLLILEQIQGSLEQSHGQMGVACPVRYGPCGKLETKIK